MKDRFGQYGMVSRNLPKLSRKPGPRYKPKPLTTEQQNLAVDYMAFARAVAKPWKLLFPHLRDEYESSAMAGLVEAARTWDSTRGTKFTTWAKWKIRFEMSYVGRDTREEDSSGEEPRIYPLIPCSEECGTVLVASHPPRVGKEFDDIDSVEGMLRRLPSRNASVCRMIYIYGKTQTEIGLVLGCSQTEVTRLHKQSLELLSDDPYAGPRFRRASRSRSVA